MISTISIHWWFFIIENKDGGSNPEFPYQPQNFNLCGGIDYSLDAEQLEKVKALLPQRKENEIRIKVKAEEVMNSASVRMQCIIRLKVFQQKKWDEVAAHMGGKCTADSVRMEFQDIWKKNKVCSFCSHRSIYLCYYDIKQ